MAEELFRQKNLKRISSPEELDKYIKVSNPSIWLVLGTLIVLTIGFCFWGMFGKFENSICLNATVLNGEITAVISANDASGISVGTDVEWNGDYIGDIYSIDVSTNGDVTVKLKNDKLENGNIVINVIKESINPFYFILN